MLKKAEQKKKVRAENCWGIERKERVEKAVERNAGNQRGRKIGLGDMFKLVHRRWIRGGVEWERARDNEREKERASGMRR